MKVAFVRKQWRAAGGAENYLRRLAQQLQARGMETLVLAESWPEDTAFDERVLLEQKGTTLTSEAFAKQANAITADKDWFVFSQEQGVRCDLYRAGNGLHAQWLAIRSKWQPLRTAVSKVVNSKHRNLLALEKETFRLDVTKHVIANSEMVLSEICRFYDYAQQDVSVITNGVDAEFFRGGDRAQGRSHLGLSADDFVVLLVGRGSFRKGHHFAKAVQKRLGDSAKVVIVKSAQSIPMRDIYAAADVFYLPTLYDPFANVTLEAMAAGLPVITTKTNGASQYFDHGTNGFLVQPDDIDSTSEIISALRDNQYAEQITTAGKRTVDANRFETKVQATIDLMQGIQAAKLGGADHQSSRYQKAG